MNETITNQEFQVGDKVTLKTDDDYVGPLQYGTEYTVRSVGPDPDHLLGVEGEEHVSGLWYPWRFTKATGPKVGETWRMNSYVRVGADGPPLDGYGGDGTLAEIVTEADEAGDLRVRVAQPGTSGPVVLWTHRSTLVEKVEETAFGNPIVDLADEAAVERAIAAARAEERAIAQRNLDRIMDRLNEASLEGVSGGDPWCKEYDHAVDRMEGRLEGEYTLKRRYGRWNVTRRYRVSAWVEHTFEGISAATEEEAIAEARDQSTTSREDAQALRDFLDNGDTPSDDGQSEWQADSAD